MPLFDDTEHDDDPLLEEQIEQFYIGQDKDADAIREKMLRDYETPQSAIEDYRKGYISDKQLEIRFSPEEVVFIKREKQKRDGEDSHSGTGGYL